ncbi:SGNH/GDSL hydrolase family protein [Sphingomonas oligophenolica]
MLMLTALSMPVEATTTCSGGLCNAEALRPWFAKLALAGRARGKPPLHILQIGDSHTAGDAVTGGWRTLLQERTGSGGHGVLAPGRPYDGYITQGVTVSMSPGWSVGATFGKDAHEPRPRLGLSGFSLTSTAGGASMALRAEPAMAFDRFTLCAIGGVDRGGVAVRFDGVDRGRIDFSAPAGQPACRTIRADGLSLSVEIMAERPGLTITSWATFSDDGGVALSNLGVVGSQLAHFARTDDAVVAEELKAYRPDLIVLAFGTNEGFAPHFDAVAYEAILRLQVARLRRLSGDVPILLLGAPDSLSRQPALRANAAGVVIECETVPGTDAHPALFAPPALAMVRAIQRRIADDLGLAFWDWQMRMGGPCAARGWVKRDVPLMRGDYVHFNKAGGLEIARALQADLDRGAALAE